MCSPANVSYWLTLALNAGAKSIPAKQIRGSLLGKTVVILFLPRQNMQMLVFVAAPQKRHCQIAGTP
jgi:hypothetical protein